MTVKHRQVAALTAFEIDRVAEGLDDLKPPPDILPSRATAKLVAYFEHLDQAVDELVANLEIAKNNLVDGGLAASGLSVALAAELLGVSEPTVREWTRRGALKQVEHSKPALLDPTSVATARRALEEIRARAKSDPDWAGSLYDAVESAAILDSPSVKSGLEQFKRGELEPA